jgi:hypothetical protein
MLFLEQILIEAGTNLFALCWNVYLRRSSTS